MPAVWEHDEIEVLCYPVSQLPEFDGAIDLASLYDGLTFRALPRLGFVMSRRGPFDVLVRVARAEEEARNIQGCSSVHPEC